jgi:hypothetical protein
VKTLLNSATPDRILRGEIVFFDVMSSYAVASARSSLSARTGAETKWAVDDVWPVESTDTKLRMV